MKIYSSELCQKIIKLREQGFTYPEIQQLIGQDIPKGSMSYICRNVVISSSGQARLLKLINLNRDKARSKAVLANRKYFEQKLESYRLKTSRLL